MKTVLLAVGLWMLAAVTLFGQALLSGKIMDEHGKPLPGTTVTLKNTPLGTLTDGQGIYKFENLPPGAYELQADYIGYDQKNNIVQVADGVVTLDLQLRERSIPLDELTVYATRAGEKSPFSFTNVSKAELEFRNLGQDFPYLLDATPSVVTTSDAGAGVGYTGIRIRGTDATRINVTINGIPLNDAESQQVYWVDLPDFASSTEDVQIQRGVGSSTNGAGAFGASVNLNTNRLHEKAYAELSASAGSFGTRKITLQGGSGLLGKRTVQPRTTGFSIDARASKITSDGYIDRASSDLKSGFVSAAWLGKNKSLRLNVFSGKEVTYQAWYGVPAQYIGVDSLRTYNPAGTEKPGEPYDHQVDDYQQTHLQLIYNQVLGKNWSLSLAGHYTRGKGFYEEYKANEYWWKYPLEINVFLCDTCVFFEIARRKWLDNHFFGGVWSLNFQSKSKGFGFTFGGAANRFLNDHFGTIDPVDSNFVVAPGYRFYDESGDKTDVNVFAKIQYAVLPKLNAFLDLQLRRVDYEILVKNITDPTGTEIQTTQANYHFFNPKAGFYYDLSKKTGAYASFAVAQKEPNRDDFTDAATGQTPKPERLFNTEAGVRIREEKGSFNLNAYHMRYKNQLVLTGNINDTGAPIRINVPDSYRLGLEFSGNLRLAKGLSLDANTTLCRNKIRNFTEYVDDWSAGNQVAFRRGTTDIAFSPSLVAFGRLSFEPTALFPNTKGRLIFSFSGKHVGKQFIDNSSNEYTQLNAYTVSDFQFRYVFKPKFCKEINLNLLILNWLNANYSSNAWTYRYISPSYDARPYDPYTRLENGVTYNQTGYFPQAGRHFLAGLTVRF